MVGVDRLQSSGSDEKLRGSWLHAWRPSMWKATFCDTCSTAQASEMDLAPDALLLVAISRRSRKACPLLAVGSVIAIAV